jgi:hypothetical protein
MGRWGEAAGDGADLWQTLSSSGLYRLCYVGDVGLRLLGREIEVLEYPEDMTYVNPAIYVFERAVAQVEAGRTRGKR